VTWYTSLVVGMVVRPMVKAFAARYPDVKVNFVPVPWQEAVVRLTNEKKAGGPRGDVFDGGATVFPLLAADLVASYHPQSAADYSAAFRDPAGHYTGIALQYMTPAVNTDMVNEDAAPKTFEDLLDSKWKGRMAWTTSPSASGPPGFVGNILMTMGQDKGMEYLRKLAGQRIANVPANQRVVLDQCIAGQYPLVLCTMNFHAAVSIAQGAPIRWLKIPPTIQTFNAIGVVKDSPHPSAARLFVEYVLSDEGQQVMREAGYIPAAPGVPAPVADLKPDIGKFEVNTIGPTEFHAHAGEWIKIYKSMFE
jgi:iron(III) transport system substrate-binding protein